MIKYPHTEQFKNLERQVKLETDFVGLDENGIAIYKHTVLYPIVKFFGTPKLHGTNAAIARYADGRIEYQSRERVLTIADDNAGFCAMYSGKNTDYLFNRPFTDHMIIYGEWCGGSIQKGVALNQLPKMFVAFAVLLDGQWVDFDYNDNPELRIYTLKNFVVETTIDFNNPDLSFVDEMTKQTSERCVFSESFGKSGIGEGYVWISANRKYVFKSKNEEHKIASSQPKVTLVSNTDAEVAFVNDVCNENRMENVYQNVSDALGIQLTVKNTGDFLGAITFDILREEQATILESELDVAAIKKLITPIARTWFMKKV